MKTVDIPTLHLHLGQVPETIATMKEIAEWLNNPLIVRFSEQRHKQHNLETQFEYVASLKDDDYYVGIWRDNKLIGTMTVDVDTPNRVGNMGILIGDHAHWGQGYGFEAWRVMIGHLLDNGMRKVEAGCMSCNLSMMSICRRMGMIEEGRLKNHFLYHEVPMDLVMWGSK